MRDAARYKRNKGSGKSGDSGGETDELDKSQDSSQDDYPFLTPTSSKYPRKTTSFGGSSSSKNSLTQAVDQDDWVHDDNGPGWLDDDSNSSSSVYSHVSILLSIGTSLVFYLLCINACVFCNCCRQLIRKEKKNLMWRAQF